MVDDLKVIVFDGKIYVVDGKEVVFVVVGCKVVIEVICVVKLIVFEFIVNIEIVVLEIVIGDLIGDFVGWCGYIIGIEGCGYGLMVIVGEVLLVEFNDY